MVRRTKENAQETRRQILEAAEKAFYEKGLARTTLERIATLAGVTRGAIYWHFSNKADLVQAMLNTLHEPLAEVTKTSESKDEMDPMGCLRRLLIHLFHQVGTNPKTRRINEIFFHKCELIDETFHLARQRQAASLDCKARIVRSLNNAKSRGQMPEDLDTVRAAISLHAYIDGILYKWLLTPESFQLHAGAERWVDAGLDMLRLSPSLRK
ncbi:TetR family transcriptional regulator [Pseudomonas marginalis]|uniref:TetR family transcriptional regulator n=2 Tax=Gammaproteobacteria TaxID=1236 RepID=A0A9X9BPR9_PSEMA|nr:TetR family transcriptional regulator [Pseudomonas marginalis]TWR56150.1 TetR family transcriptional regulator [Pseudomonas marginalis]SEB62261.1 transcriptional regulator, TetR family [Pseudomonas marginalis]